MKIRQISPLKLYLLCFGFFLLIMVLFRVAFWIFASSGMNDPLGYDAFKAFSIGVRFDARISIFITLPLAVILTIPPLARNLYKAAAFVTAFYAVVLLGLIVIYGIDFGFYAYLGSRLSWLFFELLEDFQVAVDMALQTYPVTLIIIAVLAGTALCSLVFYFIIRTPVKSGPVKKSSVIPVLIGAVIIFSAIFGQYNSNFIPLRWSNAFFTTSAPVIALGLNPVQSLYDTHDSSAGTFSVEKTREAYPWMAEFLLVDHPDIKTLNYLRSFPAKNPFSGTAGGQQSRAGATPPNVVIIIMESLAYPKTSFAQGKGDPTPHLKALAKESLLFHRFFCNARTTARAIFNVMTGLPDINEGSTGSRNPLVVDQRVIGNEFKDYKKYYMIGGDTGWANIRAILGQNIENLTILEGSYWKAPSADVWGISDYDLFHEAHQVFAAQDPSKPFLAVIQTASYHRPYTIPPTPGFHSQPLSPEDMHNYGFESQKEYDSMRYADFAVGEFMRLAKEADYYKNTIFFIFGDHGLNDISRNMPAGYDAAYLAPWHIPLIIHTAPEMGLISPGESDMLCSQVDIFPTAAALAGIAYNDWTLGRNIFDKRYDDSRIVYISGKNDAPMRILFNDYCYYDNKAGTQALYRITDQKAVDYSASKPELFEWMRQKTEYIDATIRYMLFNNKKEDAK